MNTNRGAQLGMAIFIGMVVVMILIAILSKGGSSEPYGYEPEVCSQAGYGSC